MSDKDFQNFKRNLRSNKLTASLIRLKEFQKFDGAYLRRDFIHPRNVKVKRNKVTFSIENWVTLKSMDVTVDYKDIVYFEFASIDQK